MFLNKKNNLTKKIILGFFLATIIFLFVNLNISSVDFSVGRVIAEEATSSVTSTAKSNNNQGSSLGVVGVTLRFILLAIMSTVGVVIALITKLLVVIVTLNQTLLSFNPPLIITGWTVFRDLANIGFVFGIIVIGISTILRYKGYTAQALLGKLILAALIVNFSLVIAGTFVKISDDISLLLIKEIAGGNNIAQTDAIDGFGKRVLDMFKIQDIVIGSGQTRDSLTGILIAATNGGGLGSAILGPIGYVTGAALGAGSAISGLSMTTLEVASQFINIVVAILIAISLFSLLGFFFIRFFKISFLLMLSPIIWLLWIFPYTQKHFKNWWNEFTKWLIAAPVTLLFLYITILVLNSNSYEQIATNSSSDPIAGSATPFLPMASLVRSIMAIALLMGGLKISMTMGNEGAGMALNAFNKAKKGTTKWAKTKSRRGYERTKSGLLKSKAGQKFQAGVAKIPLLGGKMSRQLKREEASSAKESGAHIRDFQQSLQGLNIEDKKKMLPTLRGEKRFALMQELLKSGATAKELGLTDEDLKMLHENDLRFNREDKLVQSAMGSMSGDQLANSRGGLSGELQEQADIQIALKGAMARAKDASGNPLNFDHMMPIIDKLKANGQMDQVKKVLASMGLSSQAVTILTAMKDAELHGATSTLEYEINGVKKIWTTADLEKEMSFEQDNIRSSQSVEDLQSSIKNRGGEILDPVKASTFYGSNSAGAKIVSSDMDYFMDNPAKIRNASPAMDPTQRNGLKKEVSLGGLRTISDRIVNLTAKKVAAGGVLPKKEADLLASLTNERATFSAELGVASVSNDYRNLGKMMSDSSSSSLQEVRDIGRAIR